MEAVLTVCGHCERSPAEINDNPSENDALRRAWFGGRPVLLCPKCISGVHIRTGKPYRDPLELYEEDVTRPINLPPGVISIEHACVVLLADGLSMDEATFEIELVEEDTGRVGCCPECGSIFFSAYGPTEAPPG